jgi:hypothetical protein
MVSIANTRLQMECSVMCIWLINPFGPQTNLLMCTHSGIPRARLCATVHDRSITTIVQAPSLHRLVQRGPPLGRLAVHQRLAELRVQVLLDAFPQAVARLWCTVFIHTRSYSFTHARCGTTCRAQGGPRVASVTHHHSSLHDLTPSRSVTQNK